MSMDDFIKTEYPNLRAGDLYIFDWNVNLQIGCFHLTVGDLEFDEVLNIGEHIEAQFMGTDEDGIDDITPFQLIVRDASFIFRNPKKILFFLEFDL